MASLSLSLSLGTGSSVGWLHASLPSPAWANIVRMEAAATKKNHGHKSDRITPALHTHTHTVGPALTSRRPHKMQGNIAKTSHLPEWAALFAGTIFVYGFIGVGLQRDPYSLLWQRKGSMIQMPFSGRSTNKDFLGICLTPLNPPPPPPPPLLLLWFSWWFFFRGGCDRYRPAPMSTASSQANALCPPKNLSTIDQQTNQWPRTARHESRIVFHCFRFFSPLFLCCCRCLVFLFSPHCRLFSRSVANACDNQLSLINRFVLPITERTGSFCFLLPVFRPLAGRHRRK